MFAKTLFLIIFFAVMIAIGVITRKQANSVDNFVLGGRSIGPWLTAFAYGTSYFSAVVFVGYAGQFGWKYGIASTWIGIGNAIIGSLLAWMVLGRRTRVMTNHLNSKTMPDFFGKRYDSKSLKLVASAIIFIFMVPYTASIYNGLSRLFAMAFDVPFFACVIVMAALTCIYVILGGYMATAWNDFIQGIIMLFGICAVIASVLAGKGGFMEALNQLSLVESDAAATMGQQGAFISFFGADPMSLLWVIILTSLGTWGLPQMIHKFYAIKDEKAIKSGTVISTIFALIISGGCYFLGGFGRLFDNAALHNADGSVIYDGIIPYMLSKSPDIIIGIVIVLVLSASMSTLASLVLTSSSTLTLDFISDTIVKNMSENKKMLIMRIFIIFFIALSVILALNPPTFIAQLMGISWGALAGAFLAPFLYGLYWKRVTVPAVWASFIFGVGITVLNIFVPLFESSIVAGSIAMIGGLIIVPIISLITKKPDTEHINDIFECYDEKITVTKKRSLAEKAIE
jgi:SSS family solute:Na+ symporter